MANFDVLPRTQLDVVAVSAGESLCLTAAKDARDRTTSTAKKGTPWTEQEHLAFLVGLQKLGKGNWRNIARYYVPSRTPTQVASHAQKHFMRLSGVTKRKSRFAALEQTVCASGMLVEGPPCLPTGTIGTWAGHAGPVTTLGVPVGMPVFQTLSPFGAGGGSPHEHGLPMALAHCTAGPMLVQYGISYGVPAPTTSAGSARSTSTAAETEQYTKVCRPTACHASDRGVGLARLREALAPSSPASSCDAAAQPVPAVPSQQPSSSAFQPSTHSAFSPLAAAVAAV